MIRVFDTSALISDPSAILKGYPGDDIIIPSTVLEEEIDKLKSQQDYAGSAARQVIRNIEALREHGNVSDGVEREVGGTFRVELNHITDSDKLLPPNAVVNSNDKKIILVTINLDNENDEDVILITQDISQSIIAETWGVKSERLPIVPDGDELPVGIVEVDASAQEINDIYAAKGKAFIGGDIPVNSGVILRAGVSQSALAISDGDGYVYRAMTDIRLGNIEPRGAEQIIAANLLMGYHAGDNSKEFIGSLNGRAGSGKTLMALSAGIKRVMAGDYSEIIIFRPTEPVGRDLGFLPGGMDEKMEPWSAAINDVIEEINTSGSSFSAEEMISVQSSIHVRGRTFRNKWVIIEEAQNYEPLVLRTLLSRMGRDTAVVLTWDPSQVDNPYLRRNSAEGPVSIMKKLLGYDVAWHVQLKNPERGGISALID